MININFTIVTSSSNESDNKKCEMFGSFGFIIQIVLGIIAFMVLICKKGLLLCNNINSKTLFRKTKTSLEDLVFRCF